MDNADCDPGFETVRQRALRSFEVEFRDGSKESVWAHFTDVGDEKKFLCFVVISPRGLQTISHAWHVDLVKGFREITAGDARTLRARDEFAVRLGDTPTTVKVPAGKGRQVN